MLGNFLDDIDCNSFFDQIDDLLDFPAEDIDVCFPKESSESFLPVWDVPTESLPNSDSVLCDDNNNSTNNDLSAELAVPYEDIVQLEWLSNFVEDSFSGGDDLTIKTEELVIDKEEISNNQFRTSSPISVLESSSSCSGGEKNATTAPQSPETTAPRCGRARSKRPRPATFSPRPPIQLISTPNQLAETTHPFVAGPSKGSSDSENFSESRSIIRIPKHVITEHKKKKKMKKMSVPLAPVDDNQDEQSIRKCMHCEITKTPQWRAGPMGPKTLCNACGVRYKSGRLFPEYRPAASPTFVPSLHSNSHKKVVEMRAKNIKRATEVPQVVKTAPEPPVLIPNNASVDYS